jgi:hypothetical protein
LASVVVIVEGDEGLDPLVDGEGAFDGDPVHAASAISTLAMSRAVVALA